MHHLQQFVRQIQNPILPLLFTFMSLCLSLPPRQVVASAWQTSDAQIYNFLSDKCLQPLNESTAQGAPIVQQPCNTHAAQQWTRVAAGKDVFHFVNGLSGLCLDARGPAASHTPVQQWTCNKISNQNWNFGIKNNLLTSFVSNTLTHCVASPGNQDGLAMELRACDIIPAQIWSRPPG